MRQGISDWQATSYAIVVKATIQLGTHNTLWQIWLETAFALEIAILPLATPIVLVPSP